MLWLLVPVTAVFHVEHCAHTGQENSSKCPLQCYTLTLFMHLLETEVQKLYHEIVA